MRKYSGELILFFVTFIAASGWFFSKYSLEGMPQMGFIGLRFTIAFLIFLPFSYSTICKLEFFQIMKAVSVGLAYILTMVLWLSGLILSEYLGEGAFLYSLSMLIAPLISWGLFKHKPQKIFWISLPIAVLGLYCLLGQKSSMFHFSLSNIIFLLASISAALYFVLNNQFAKNIPPLALTTIQIGVVGVLAGLYSLLVEKWLFPISMNTLFWFAGSILIATNLRVFLQTIAQNKCSINNAAVIMLLEPIWTLVLSIFFLGEIFSFIKILGCSLILISLIIYRLPKLTRVSLE